MKRTGLKGRTHLEKSKLYNRSENGDELSAKLNVLVIHASVQTHPFVRAH